MEKPHKLKRTASSTQHIDYGVVDIPEDTQEVFFSFRKLMAFAGPGWLMSIAYLDPGNIESDLQSGAVGNYQLLWVLWWSTVAGLFLQFLSVKLAIVYGHNLAETCRKHYSPPIRYTLWIMMEIAIIASDIQEVIGSAIAISILSSGKIKLWQGSLITAIDTFTFLLLERFGLRKLEAFFGALITVMSVTFGYMYVQSHANQLEVFTSILVPEVSEAAVEQAIGTVGAVIMPHNLYLHSALVLSRNIDFGNIKKVKEARFYYFIESAIALLVSFVINLFVLAVFAEAFYDRTDIPTKSGTITANDIDLLVSGDVLERRFGHAIKYIWALGLLAAGQSSTMTGTYAGQFVMEGFLQLKISPWKRVAITRSCAMVPTVLVAVFANSSSLNGLNEWLNVLQSIQLPFALLPVVHFTSIRAIMGDFTNGPLTAGTGWLLSLGIIGINLYLVVTTIQTLPKHWWLYLSSVLVFGSYMLLITYLAVGPFLPFGSLQSLYSGRAYSKRGGENEPLLLNEGARLEGVSEEDEEFDGYGGYKQKHAGGGGDAQY